MDTTDPESINQIAEAVKTWLATDGLDFGIRIVTSLLIFVIGKWIAKGISGEISKGFARERRMRRLTDFSRASFTSYCYSS